MQQKITRQPSALVRLATWPVRMVAKAFNLATLHTSSWFMGFTATWHGTEYQTLAEKGMKNPFVARAWWVISRNMASVPIIAYYTEVDGEDVNLREDPDHELANLLKRPNAGQSWKSFVEQMVGHFFFAGELFFYAPESPLTGANAGKPTEGLYLLEPDRVTEIVRNDDDVITGYRYINRKGKQRLLPAARVRHLKLWGPGTGDRGYALIRGAWRSVCLMEEGDEWNKSVFQQKGRIPGFFKYTGQGKFNETSFKRTAQGMQEAYAHDSAESRPGLLDGDYDFLPTATTVKDADWLESDKHNGRKVCIALGVDPAIMGDSDSNKYANMGVALKTLFMLTILPMLDFVLDELNTWYMPMYAGERWLGYDKDQIEALQEDMTEKYKRMGQAFQDTLVDLNEARGALGWGARKEPEADMLFINFNRQPISGGMLSAGIESRDLSKLEKMSESEFVQLVEGVMTNGKH